MGSNELTPLPQDTVAENSGGLSPLDGTWFRLGQVARGAVCMFASSMLFASSTAADTAQVPGESHAIGTAPIEQPVKVGQAHELSVCGNPGFNAPADMQMRVMQCLLNHARSNQLTINPLLGGSARQKILDEISCNNFSHTPCVDEETLKTLTLQQQKKEALKDLPSLIPDPSKGEILAYGCGLAGTAQEIFSGWMHSPEHRPVIENEDYTLDGISRVWLPETHQFNLAPLCNGEPTAEWAVHFEGP